MASDTYARHPVWSFFDSMLEHQILEACRLCEPPLTITDDDLAHLVSGLIHGLACGWSQKETFKEVTPCFGNPQHDAVFAELCNWIFATERVLSNLYQPLLSHFAVEAGHNYKQVKHEVAVSAFCTQVPTISQHSNLLRLPNELFDHVLEYLPSQDINDLRLSCRQSRIKTFPFWSKTFFSTRQFMIDEYSLQSLLDISLHPELSRVLTHLVIGVDEIDTKDTLSCIMDSHATSPSRVPTLFRYWRDAASAQQALLNTGRAAELLSRATSNLTNLHMVSVSGSKLFCYAPYYDSMFRYPDLGMRSYGSSAYQMQDRYTTSVAPSSKGFVDKVFNCVLNSLARSAPNITTLRTNLDTGDFLEHLNDEAFNLPAFAPFYSDGFALLARLSELHLDVNLASRSVHKLDQLSDHEHTFDPCNIGLRELLCATGSLESLTLNFYGGEFMENHCDFTDWLCEPADGTADATAYWPCLRRLVLKRLFVSPSQLRAIFAKFDTLRSAALRRVFLRRCFVDHPPVPEHSTDDLDNLWARFFRGSSGALANLESLELDKLAVMQYRDDPEVVVSTTDKDIEAVVFVSEGLEDSADPPSRSVRVTDFRKDALERLAEETWFFTDWQAAQDDAEED